MREKETVGAEHAFVDKGFFFDAVVGGLVVLETEVRDLIRERDEEVIAVVVARHVECAGFTNEFGELVDVLLREENVFGAVAGEV